ncbi:MAG: hypothetical protein IKR57_06670 [Bacilli bacterium]|nr:hypothetical protein [Bacilli bacterium]
MNKTYFFVKPSEFNRYGQIDIDGKVDEVQCSDFDMPNEKENVMIFEAYYDDYNGHRDFVPYVRHIGSNKKFKLEVFKLRGKGPTCINIYSEKLGLYMENALPIGNVEVDGIKVSGLLMHLQENPEEKAKYAYEIREMIETAEAFKHIYDNSVDGPSRYIKNETIKAYRRAKHLKTEDK